MDDKMLNVIINVFIIGTVIGAVTETVWQLMEQKSPPLQDIDNTAAPLSTLPSIQGEIQDIEMLEQVLVGEAMLLW